MHLNAGSIILLTFCGLGLTQNKGHFIVPPDPSATTHFDENNVYTIGQTLAVRWSMSLDGYAVWLWQQSPTLEVASQGPTVYTKLPGSSEPGGFNWTVDEYNFDLSQSNVFFLAIDTVQGPITSNTVTSHYFNLTQSSANPSASSLSSSSVAPTSTSVSSNSSVTSISSSSDPTAYSGSLGNSTTSGTPNNSPSNDTILKISLGVSIGFGVPLLALGLYIALVIGRKHKRPSKPQFDNGSTAAYDLGGRSNLPTSPQEMMAPHEFRHMVRSDRTTKYLESEAIELPGEKPDRVRSNFAR